MLTITIIGWLFQYGITYAKVHRNDPSYTIPDWICHLATERGSSWKYFYDVHNFSGYLLKCGFNLSSERISIDDGKMRMIQSHLSSITNTGSSSASFEGGKEPQNLILIIVESLPYNIIESPIGRELAPNLRALADDSASLKIKCKVLVGNGRSSEAQLMYNTGLLRLKEGPFAANFAVNDFPSLPKALGLYSFEIIGENEALWAHKATNKSYGYDKLVANVAPNGLNQDSLILKRAITEIKNTKVPFFATVTTITMHGPFTDKKTTNSPPSNKYGLADKRDSEYFTRLSYFDKQLGTFINDLKAINKYEDSLIIIIGDHNIGQWEASELLWDDYVPAVILNSKARYKQDREVYQTDIFPTILDLTNTDYQYWNIPYRGLGRSIFSKDTINYSGPTDKDYEISEMIIKSN